MTAAPGDAPNPPKKKLETLEDARAYVADKLEQLEQSKFTDPDELKRMQTMITGAKTFADIEIGRLKNDPKENANREAARELGRKAAEKITPEMARQILLTRNFRALEDSAGIIDVEVQAVEGARAHEEVKVLVERAEKKVFKLRRKTEKAE